MSTEYDERGWLDCNPDAKMELADLDKEECISDDETEVIPLVVQYLEFNNYVWYGKFNYIIILDS